ncbi:hypothetical protein [Geomonas subterranea]|uniref:hypothetical protein n=1 Tax=Geomonas subterranea TaxID=2847989 RepID=UPI001CD57D6A|nr:hypothetical protein [Geomonas fuzhouensis]
MDKFNSFKVDDEGGMVSVYRKFKVGRLRVVKGDVSIPAKLVAFVPAAEAEEIPAFEEFVAQQAVAAQEKSAA